MYATCRNNAWEQNSRVEIVVIAQTSDPRQHHSLTNRTTIGDVWFHFDKLKLNRLKACT